MEKNKENNSQLNSLKKEEPTFFPFGFSVGGTNDEMIIVQFLDQAFDGKQNVISSIALTKKRARLFAEKLLEVVGTYDEKK